MTITIPLLRSGTTIPITVPAGQTWIIKEWYNATSLVKITASGNQYTFSGGNSPVVTEETGMLNRLLKRVPVLKSGDSITTGNGTYLYWIAEIDFGVSTPSIPATRRLSDQHTWPPGCSGVNVTGTSYTYTIPAGKNWYMLFIETYSQFRSASSRDMLHIIQVKKNGVWYIVHSNTYTSISTDSHIYMQSLPFTGMILRAGDQLKVDITFTPSIPMTHCNNVYFRLGYWDLSLDF